MSILIDAISILLTLGVMGVCDREVDSVPLRDILSLLSQGEWRSRWWWSRYSQLP